MTVRDIMTSDVITVTPDMTLWEVDSHLRNYGFRHVPVEENGKLVGIISDRDVLRSMSPFVNTPSEKQRDVRTLERQAREFMREAPVCIGPDEPIEEAARILLEEGISSLPVLTETGEIVGILTNRDVMRHFAQKTV